MGDNQNSTISNKVDFGLKDYKKVVQSNNQLAFELLTKLDSNHNGNIFISPTSLFMALSLVHNGATDITKDEIEKVLYVTGIEKLVLNKSNASWMNILDRDMEKVQLHIANSIWVNDRYHVQEEFSKLSKDYFNAHIEEINVSSNEAVEQINDWIQKSTNNKINEMINYPLSRDLVMLLVNAIHFDGKWKYEFERKRTKDSPFYVDNETITEVPLMNLNEKKLAYLENEHFQAVSIPYGDEEMSMQVFLPRKENGLEGLLEVLTYENWKKWSSDFRKKEGTVFLPRFELEYEVTLNETLKNLGMKSAFGSEASFKSLVKENDPIWVSEVKQKTFIDVNEEGTEAAATTKVEVVTESANFDGPFQMRIDRPFIFMITDDKSETILFIGSITNPQ